MTTTSKTCSLTLDLLTLSHQPTTDTIVALFGVPYQRDRIVFGLTLALASIFLAVGFRVATVLRPARHRFRLHYDTTFFIIFLCFAVLAVLDLVQLMFHLFNVALGMPVIVAAKCLVIGFLALYLLYSFFDCQIVIVKRELAKCYVRCYLRFLLLGLIVSLSINAVDVAAFASQTFIVFRLLCFAFLWLSFGVVFIVLWYGAAHFDEHTIINNRNRTEFGFYFAIRSSARQKITLNCICFAVQSARRYSDHLAEDNCSVRTVKPWRHNCIGFLGATLFVAAFGALVFHLVFSFLWPRQYLLGFDKGFVGFVFASMFNLFVSFVGWKILSIRASFIVALVFAGTLESMLSRVLVSWYNHHHRDPLRPALVPFAARLHFLKLVTIYTMSIVANLSQLFLASYCFSLAIIVSDEYIFAFYL